MPEIAPPREGLPSCIIAYAECENRAVGIHKGDCRWGRVPQQFDIVAGQLSTVHSRNHPFAICPPFILDILTNDLVEAEDAFERGEQWVRTGELDEN